jgi:superfamily II DNA helicase RecQ
MTVAKVAMDLEEGISHSMLCIGQNFQLKSFQKEVIQSYAEREDVFCIAGTGAGKSITFVLCPIIMDFLNGNRPCKNDQGIVKLNSLVVIIQPLKALMTEQRDKLIALGLNAVYMGEDKDVSLKEVNYVIAAPESAVVPSFLDFVDANKERVKCIFIDESHCIKTL